MSRNFTTLFSAVLLVFFSLAVQFAGYINLDNAWLLNVAERVLGGEKLGTQVIESNPPLIVYLMTLPVLLADFLHLSQPDGFVVFIGLLALISAALTLPQISDWRVKLTIIFALFFLPGWSFGEREHIFIILILPYFISLWRAEKISPTYSIISGLMLGVGLSLKPFFLVIWVVLVLVKMTLERKFFSFLNLQNITALLVIAAYALYLLLLEKTYVAQVLPLLLKYYSGFNAKDTQVLKESLNTAFLSQIAFWILFFKDRKLLTRPIYFASFANLVCVVLIVVQSKIWLNYFYPPNFFGLVSNALISFAIWDNNVKPLWNKVTVIISTFIMLFFLTIAITLNLKSAFKINEEETTKVIETLNRYAAGQPVYVLTFDLGTLYPALVHSTAVYKGHYGHFWMLPGMYHGQPDQDGNLIYHSPAEQNADEKRLVAEVIADLTNYPPQIVLVSEFRYYSPQIGDYGFDFLKYFSQQPAFRKLWKNYQRIDKIGNKSVYLRRSNHVKHIDAKEANNLESIPKLKGAK